MLTITIGEKAIGELKLRDIEGDPFDMSAYDKFTVCIPSGQGQGIEITEVQNANGSIVSKITGETYQGLNLTVGKEDTKLLTASDRTYLDIELDNTAGTITKRQRIENALIIVDSCIT